MSVLEQSKADAISALLSKDAELGKSLLSMSPEDAAGQIKKLGLDVTTEELKEYGEALRAGTHPQEGDDGMLEGVAGGVGVVDRSPFTRPALPIVTLPGILPIHVAPGIKPLPGVVEPPVSIAPMPINIKW